MIQIKLDNYRNEEYQPGSKLKIGLWYFVNIIFFINPLNPISSLKVGLLRLFGAKIGEDVYIKPSVNIKYPWLLEVGNNVWIEKMVG